MKPAPVPIRVRPVRAADLDRLAGIAGSLETASRWQLSDYERLIGPFEPRRIALVGEEALSGEIAGFAVAVLVPPEAELETVAVAPGFQRRGIGSQLLRDLVSALRSAGITLVHLEVRASNRPALALYRRTGFSESARRPGYYADPVEDATIMSVDLPPLAGTSKES